MSRYSDRVKDVYELVKHNGKPKAVLMQAYCGLSQTLADIKINIENTLETIREILEIDVMTDEEMDKLLK